MMMMMNCGPSKIWPPAQWTSDGRHFLYVLCLLRKLTAPAGRLVLQFAGPDELYLSENGVLAMRLERMLEGYHERLSRYGPWR